MSKTPDTNPLLEPSKLPYGAPPLDSVKVEHFLPAQQAGIAEAKADIAAIKTNKAPATFENTIEALEFAGRTLSRVMTVFGNISAAASSDALRAIEGDLKVAAVKHSNDIMMDADLFKRVKEVYDQKDSLKLSGEQRMLLEETYKGFVRSGALLDETQKTRLREISEKMTELRTEYKNNSLKSVAAYQKVIDDESELAGVPERAKAAYREAAEAAGLTGKFVVKLSPPPLDIMAYCENRALREEISRALANVAYKDEFDNTKNAMEIAKLRHEAAGIMGYDSHAAFVLDNRMAKTPEAVNDFLAKNEKVYRPAAEEYLQKVKDYAQKTDGITDFKPWDMAYYGRKLKEEEFSLSMESLRPYFDLEKVLEGMRKHAEKLFNIDMTEVKGKYPVYHEDVKVYEVTDKKTGEMIGLFYGDYYARPGAKSGGAWMNTFRNRGIEDGENQFAIVTNVCNFQKPTKDHPTLLSIDEVRTVFHEFGHGLHALLAKGDYASLTGTNVKWDFVELPSQLQENWAKQKEVLDTFARHYKNGDLLAEDLIKKVNDMENFDAGYVGLRQTFLGKLDMAWHGGDPKNIKGVEELEDKLIAETWLFPRAAGPMSTSFGHIFSGGYSAGYYSYKWAEVLEADMFEEFEQKGLYDRATGDRLRDTIYAQGGTRDPMDIFKDAKGREPDPNALFRREGLLPQNDNQTPQANRKSGPQGPKQ
ncbi:MAG: M3 family metallopeptidase [Alphaproteobacteria bacterium]|nr:M3 family metallopeptidase [Alphaproteobacteria bacterium]HRI75724.1 M3 family metallopeptidase [Alphaproteobacteria bacterium]